MDMQEKAEKEIIKLTVIEIIPEGSGEINSRISQWNRSHKPRTPTSSRASRRRRRK
jgi:hypothetical protein